MCPFALTCLNLSSSLCRIQEASRPHQEEVWPGDAVAEEAPEGLPAVHCGRPQRPETRGPVHEGSQLTVQTARGKGEKVREWKQKEQHRHNCIRNFKTIVKVFPPLNSKTFSKRNGRNCTNGGGMTYEKCRLECPIKFDLACLLESSLVGFRPFVLEILQPLELSCGRKLTVATYLNYAQVN